MKKKWLWRVPRLASSWLNGCGSSTLLPKVLIGSVDIVTYKRVHYSIVIWELDGRFRVHCICKIKLEPPTCCSIHLIRNCHIQHHMSEVWDLTSVKNHM